MNSSGKNVLILDAGKGVRFFGSEKDEYHKCLLKLNGETILDRQIRLLNKAGLTDITVAIDAETGQKIKDALVGRTVKIIEVTCHKEKYEKNWTLFQFKDLFSNTLILNGDVIFSENTIPEILSLQIDDILFIGRTQNYSSSNRPPPIEREEIYMILVNEKGAKILRNYTNPFAGGFLWEDTKMWDLFWDLYRKKFKPFLPLTYFEGLQDVDYPEDLLFWQENHK